MAAARLRSHLLFWFCIVAFVPLFIFSGWQVQRIYQLHQEQLAVQRQLTQRLAAEIATYVTSHRQMVEVLASQYSRWPQEVPAASQALLAASLERFPGFVNLYVADRQGRSRAFYPPPGDNATVMAGYDFSSRNYFPVIAAAQQTVISPLFPGQVGTSKDLVVIAAPVFTPERQFDGYVSAALDVSAVAELAAKYTDGSERYVVVTDPEGHVLYQPARRRVPANLADNALWQAVRYGSGTVPDSDVDAYVATALLPETQWVVLMYTPKALYQAELYQAARLAAGLFGGTLLLTLLLSWALARRLNQPIAWLTASSRQLGQGELQLDWQQWQRWHMPSEFNHLAQQFQKMAAQVAEKRQALLALNRALEERVEERTDHLLAVLESMRDGLLLVSQAGTVQYANGQLQALLGLSPALDGQPMTQLIAYVPGQTNREDLQAVLQGERQSATLLLDDDKRCLVVTAFTVCSTKQGQLIGRGYLWRDVTREREIDQIKTHLISLAAHEFKTPLTGIRGSVETLLRQDVAWEADFQEELLRGMQEDALRIQSLIDDWLDISKLAAGSLQLRRETVRLAGAVERAAEQVRKRQVAFTLDNQVSDTLEVWADGRRLQQVLENMLHNAALYCVQEAQITIRASNEGGETIISIEDNGIGIAEADYSRIFEQFYRVERTANRRTGGTGLGLAICRGIVEAHQGRIWLTSRLQQGSCFYLALPQRETVVEREDTDAQGLYCGD